MYDIMMIFNFFAEVFTSISGEMNVSFYTISGFKPRLNAVKASGGCLGFFNGILSGRKFGAI